jgi:hypothetical protein
MATKWITLKCRVRWAQFYEPEEFSGDTRWIGTFYPVDGSEWEKYSKSGLQMVPKEDNDGHKFIRIRRPLKKLFPKDDEATYFVPPKITGAVNVAYHNAATGEELRTYKKSDKIEIKVVGEKTNIGNDSIVNVNIAVFDTGQGKGHRMESLNVLDLVEYNPESKTEEVQKSEEPEPKKTNKKSDSTEEVKKDMNDELPW